MWLAPGIMTNFAPGLAIAKLHVGNRGEIDLSAIELADCRAKGLALLVRSPRFRHL